MDGMALMRGAINGMMQALGDKQSTYMDPPLTNRPIQAGKVNMKASARMWMSPPHA
ncbi:MAG: hypothetical protein IPO36_01915 [Anaerolineales bacterium]|nr:hypothetical protein [Anaerolineales bacterium]